MDAYYLTSASIFAVLASVHIISSATRKMKIGIGNEWLFFKLTVHGIFYFYLVLAIYLLQIPSYSIQRGSFYASVNPAAKFLSACQRKALKPVKEGKWNKKVYWHLSQSASS